MSPRLTSRSIELRRVVVTGMGTVNPLGNDIATSWEALCSGTSGVGLIQAYDTDQFSVKIAAELKDFDPSGVVAKKSIRRLDPVLLYALVAAQQAVDDSELKLSEELLPRTGVLVGSGIGGLRTIEQNHTILLERGPRRVSPFFIPHLIANMASGLISIRFGARGPNSCVVTACATGSHCIGDAFRLIQRGDADVMIAGGVEAPIQPLGMAGFAAMRALSTRNEEPERASRPFDAGRDGFVVGEGAGIIVLESLESALARGARIHAELVGYGMASDAHHMTAPPTDGLGAQDSMQRALSDAGLGTTDIDYINAHGTSTPLNDRTETFAIRQVFGEHAERLAVSSSKSMIGHALGAAGGIEAIFTVLALRQGILPPTINYEDPDPECDLDYVPNTAREAPIRVALSNSFGFGGTNTTLALARWDPEQG
ncbi:MAG: beta-ketoacyl-ACP synthase II [Myxococcota bacterium]|nr:beta-ketoacyl-ACP synthase II [Myxococcota bacterium]